MEPDKRFTACRLCLCPSELLIGVFDYQDGYTPAEVITELLRFEVSMGDVYPQCVCGVCMGKLTDFKKFKELCCVFKASIDRAYAAMHAVLSPVPSRIEKIIPVERKIKQDLDEFSREQPIPNAVEGEVIVPDDPTDLPLISHNKSSVTPLETFVEKKPVVATDVHRIILEREDSDNKKGVAFLPLTGEDSNRGLSSQEIGNAEPTADIKDDTNNLMDDQDNSSSGSFADGTMAHSDSSDDESMPAPSKKFKDASYNDPEGPNAMPTLSSAEGSDKTIAEKYYGLPKSQGSDHNFPNPLVLDGLTDDKPAVASSPVEAGKITSPSFSLRSRKSSSGKVNIIVPKETLLIERFFVPPDEVNRLLPATLMDAISNNETAKSLTSKDVGGMISHLGPAKSTPNRSSAVVPGESFPVKALKSPTKVSGAIEGKTDEQKGDTPVSDSMEERTETLSESKRSTGGMLVIPAASTAAASLSALTSSSDVDQVVANSQTSSGIKGGKVGGDLSGGGQEDPTSSSNNSEYNVCNGDADKKKDKDPQVSNEMMGSSDPPVPSTSKASSSQISGSIEYSRENSRRITRSMLADPSQKESEEQKKVKSTADVDSDVGSSHWLEDSDDSSSSFSGYGNDSDTCDSSGDEVKPKPAKTSKTFADKKIEKAVPQKSVLENSLSQCSVIRKTSNNKVLVIVADKGKWLPGPTPGDGSELKDSDTSSALDISGVRAPLGKGASAGSRSPAMAKMSEGKKGVKDGNDLSGGGQEDYTSSSEDSDWNLNDEDTDKKKDKDFSLFKRKSTTEEEIVPISKVFQCNICGKKYLKKSNYKDHVEGHIYGKRYKCHLCGKGFITKRYLSVHMTSHATELNFKCDICGKSYKSYDLLRSHKITHGEKKFMCDLCGKKFMCGGTLRDHIIFHNKEKNYPCDVCGKHFYTRSHAKLHHQRVHLGEKNYKHRCDQCDRMFPSPASLKVHMMIHTGERPYTCSVCGKSTRLKNQLENHMNTHTREKNYKCDLCDAVFSHQSGMLRHRERHSGRKKYKCDQCGMEYTQSHNLKNHKMKGCMD